MIKIKQPERNDRAGKNNIDGKPAPLVISLRNETIEKKNTGEIYPLTIAVLDKSIKLTLSMNPRRIARV